MSSDARSIRTWEDLEEHLQRHGWELKVGGVAVAHLKWVELGRGWLQTLLQRVAKVAVRQWGLDGGAYPAELCAGSSSRL